MRQGTVNAPGDRIGAYALVRLLGTGGAGEVWEAVLHGPAGFRKSVALKVLRSGPGAGSARDGLVREARLGALLQHPNVVSTLGLGEHGGSWHVALELVHGVTLSELLREQGALPPGAVVEVGVQAAAGLAHVHELAVDGRPAGLVHRDVKPANLLLDRAGLVKLADLGISVLGGESARGAGTPGYTAPEQAEGRAEARSDLFALGVTLYVLATGRRPFAASQAALADLGRIEAVARAERFLAPVDAAVPGLGAIVGRCLRADPAERPATARELGELLTALRARQAPGPTLIQLLARARPALVVGATPPTPPSEAPTWVLPSGNLRTPRDGFVGRQDELAGLEALLGAGEQHLVVLLGPGGTGKTRLSLEVARRVGPQFQGGVWAFDMADARSEDGVCRAIAAGLDLPLERDAAGQLGRVLASKGRALFVVDNLEQCVGALPATLGAWAATATEATFLCTSRVALELGEHVVRVGQLEPADAVALLLARAPRPTTAAERPEVERLCAELEGMPLAIELAAARLGMMRVADIRARLGPALLAGGGRERPARQRSVQASLQWSWELLSPVGRRALCQLSVFEGGFGLEAAEAVLDLADLPGAPWALDVLRELADASLLRVDATQARFGMHMVVRAFAAAAADPAERGAAEVRHGAHFAKLGAKELLLTLDAPGGLQRRDALALDLDNLVAACRSALARGDAGTAAALQGPIWAVLLRLGPLRAGVELALEVLARTPEDAPTRAAVELHAGVALEAVGRLAEAHDHHDRALARCHAAGDRATAMRVLGARGEVRRHQARAEDARADFERALALARALGDRQSEALSLGRIGNLHLVGLAGIPVLECYTEAVALFRATGDRRFEGVTLANLALWHVREGRQAEALQLYEQGIGLVRDTGDLRTEGHLLSNLGGLHVDHGRPAPALVIFERARRLAEAVGDRPGEAIAFGNTGLAQFHLGRDDEARASYLRALALHRELGTPYEVDVRCSLAELHAANGRYDEARALLASVVLPPNDHDGRVKGVLLSALAWLARQEGRVDAARAYTLEITGRLAPGQRDGTTLWVLGLLELDRGAPAAARPLLEEARAALLATGHLRHAGAASAALARAVAATGSSGEAGRLLAEAEEAARESGDVPALALALAARAEVAHAARDRGGAEAALAEAERLGCARVTVTRELARVRASLGRPASRP